MEETVYDKREKLLWLYPFNNANTISLEIQMKRLGLIKIASSSHLKMQFYRLDGNWSIIAYKCKGWVSAYVRICLHIGKERNVNKTHEEL